jgi:hypothetical protein
MHFKALYAIFTFNYGQMNILPPYPVPQYSMSILMSTMVLFGK